MKRIILPFFLWIVWVFAGCNESVNLSKPLSQEDKDAISELRNDLISAIKAGDAKAYGQLCSDSVRLMHPNSPIFNGRKELIKHNAEMFDVVKVNSLVLKPIDIYGIGDLAYEVGTQSVNIEPAIDGFSSSRK